MIPKGIQGPLKQFQGPSVPQTHGDPGHFTLKPPLSAGSASSGGSRMLVVYDCYGTTIACTV